MNTIQNKLSKLNEYQFYFFSIPMLFLSIYTRNLPNCVFCAGSP